jgi:hypothetical protein
MSRVAVHDYLFNIFMSNHGQPARGGPAWELGEGLTTPHH